MKYFKRLLILILFFCFVGNSIVFAQAQPPKYSNAAISLYNSAVIFQKEDKLDLAEEKYTQALKLQPDLAGAKDNLVILYQKKAIKYNSENAYFCALMEIQKTFELKPDDINSYYILGQCYLRLNDFQNAKTAYNKVLSLSPGNIMAFQALEYIKRKEFQSATPIQSRVLISNTSADKNTKMNLNYANAQRSNIVLIEQAPSIQVYAKAPKELYKLIRTASGVSRNYKEQMKVILDMIWSEPNGQTMLLTIMENQTPINLTNGEKEANAARGQTYKFTYSNGQITSPTFTIEPYSAVNIPYKYIENFNKQGSSTRSKICSLEVFLHEFGHAFIALKNPNDVNSMQEEIGVSMIGYNIANKIITGNYLNREQTEMYGKACVRGVLSDQHKELPVFSGFNASIRSYGIMMPYPELYADIPQIYKQLLLEGKTSHVTSLDYYLEKVKN